MPNDVSYLLRLAQLSDAAALGALHNRVWQATYAKVAPAEAIARLDEAHRVASWKQALSTNSEREETLVAEQNGFPVGMISAGQPRGPCFGPAGEIMHFYVDLDAQGRGLGQLMLRHGIEMVERAGYPSAALSVVEQNLRARRFYARMGGVEGQVFTDPGPLWKSTNILVHLPPSRELPCIGQGTP